MKRILDLVSDPSWWFSALFVGIIASVIANLMQSSIHKTLSSFLNYQNEWLEKHNRKFAKRVENLAANSTLLTFYYIRLLFQIVLAILFLQGALAIYLYNATVSQTNIRPTGLGIINSFGLIFFITGLLIAGNALRTLDLTVLAVFTYFKKSKVGLDFDNIEDNQTPKT